MEVKLRSQWELNDPARILFNSDGSVKFKGPVGDLFLPDDYLALLKITDGLGIDYDDEDAWFVARFPNGPVILNAYGVKNLRGLMLSTWRYFDNEDHGRPLVPDGFISIGTAAPAPSDIAKGEFDVLLCCLRGHGDYGKVYAWPQSEDPWMEGENTSGLGFVANSFTEFMNNLTDRKNL